MPAMKDNVDVGRVALVGFVGAVVIYCVVIMVRVLFVNLHEAEDYEKRVAAPPRALNAYLAEQEGKLRGLDAAKQQVLTELRAARPKRGAADDAAP